MVYWTRGYVDSGDIAKGENHLSKETKIDLGEVLSL